MFDAIRVVEKAPSQVKNLVVGVFAADTGADENARPAFDAATARVIAAAGGADNAAHAIGRAARAVQCGDADVVACIGADTNHVDSFRASLGAFSDFARDATYPYGSGGPNSMFAFTSPTLSSHLFSYSTAMLPAKPSVTTTSTVPVPWVLT